MKSLRLPRSTACALLLLAACAAPGAGPAPAGDARAEITRLLMESTEGWNRRDLDAFLVPYADDATFVGSAGLVRGKPAIRETYATGWFAPGRDPGRLSFRDIEVRTLDRDHALAVGRFVVEMAGRQPATGLFSLTMRRTSQGWRIIHDHSS